MCFSFLFFFPFLAFGEQRLGGWGAVFFNQFFLSLSLSLCVSMCTKAIGDIFHLFLSIFPWKKEQTRLRPLPHLFRWKPRSSCARIENWNAKKKLFALPPQCFFFFYNGTWAPPPCPSPCPPPRANHWPGNDTTRNRPKKKRSSTCRLNEAIVVTAFFFCFLPPPLSLSFGAAKKSAP